MNDALRPDVHVGTGSHLPVLGHADGIEALPVVGAGVIGDHHAVGDNHAGGLRRRRKQPHGVARVHVEGLPAGHGGEVFHGEQVLGPVLENSAVAAVGYELFGMLGHRRVQVVLDHEHDGCGLLALGRVMADGPGKHRVGGLEAQHVNAAKLAEFFGEFGGQDAVPGSREIPERIPDGEFFLGGRQQVFAPGGAVGTSGSLVGNRKLSRNALQDGSLKIGEGKAHGYDKWKQWTRNVLIFSQNFPPCR